MVNNYIPDRGHIVWLDFSPHVGHEQGGQRPALVLSPASYNNKTGLMLVCPITSKIKQYPFEVRIKAVKIDGVILADQVKSLDWHERKPEFGGAADLATISKAQVLVESLVSG
jgi:mRNA interferase MazF